ncbi:Arpin [Balamuthia mandrillaris]
MSLGGKGLFSGGWKRTHSMRVEPSTSTTASHAAAVDGEGDPKPDASPSDFVEQLNDHLLNKSSQTLRRHNNHNHRNTIGAPLPRGGGQPGRSATFSSLDLASASYSYSSPASLPQPQPQPQPLSPPSPPAAVAAAASSNPMAFRRRNATSAVPPPSSSTAAALPPPSSSLPERPRPLPRSPSLDTIPLAPLPSPSSLSSSPPSPSSSFSSLASSVAAAPPPAAAATTNAAAPPPRPPRSDRVCPPPLPPSSLSSSSSAAVSSSSSSSSAPPSEVSLAPQPTSTSLRRVVKGRAESFGPGVARALPSPPPSSSASAAFETSSPTAAVPLLRTNSSILMPRPRSSFATLQSIPPPSSVATSSSSSSSPLSSPSLSPPLSPTSSSSSSASPLPLPQNKMETNDNNNSSDKKERSFKRKRRSRTRRNRKGRVWMFGRSWNASNSYRDPICLDDLKNENEGSSSDHHEYAFLPVDICCSDGAFVPSSSSTSSSSSVSVSALFASSSLPLPGLASPSSSSSSSGSPPLSVSASSSNNSSTSDSNDESFLHFHMLALTEDGKVWSWGDGSSGQLGHNSLQSCEVPTLVHSLSQPVIRIACAGHYSAVITANGEIMVWGEVAITNEAKAEVHLLPTALRMPALSNVRFSDICCRNYFMVALSEEGKVYYWSWRRASENSNEATGAGVPIPSRPAIIRGTEHMTFSSIVASDYFISMLSDAGEVFTYVLAEQEDVEHSVDRYEKVLGGHGGTEQTAKRLAHTLYRESSVPEDVIQIDCNDQHLLVLSSTGEITIKDFVKGNVTVRSSLVGKGITQIACTINHAVALSDAGVVYTWGLSEYGALGQGKSKAQKKPVAIKALNQVLIQKVVSNRFCTFALEDSLASDILKAKVGTCNAIATLRERLFYSMPDDVIPSASLANKNWNLNRSEDKTGMLGRFLSSSSSALKVTVSPGHLAFSSPHSPGPNSEKIVLGSTEKQSVQLIIDVYYCDEDTSTFKLSLDPVPSSLSSLASFEINADLHINTKALPINALIDLQFNENFHHFVLVKLDSPLSSLDKEGHGRLCKSDSRLDRTTSLTLRRNPSANHTPSPLIHSTSQPSLKPRVGSSSIPSPFTDRGRRMVAHRLEPTPPPAPPVSEDRHHQKESSSSSTIASAPSIAASFTASPLSAALQLIEKERAEFERKREKRRDSSECNTLSSSSSPSPSSSSSSSALTIDFKNDEIEFHEILGRGASGAVVWQCSIKGLSFAAKVLTTDDFCTPDAMARMRTEIEIMTKLKHENIVTYLGSNYDEKKKEISLYVQLYPESLDSVINKRAAAMQPFTPKEVTNFMLQICKGLHYLGTQNPPIIHRDLKSENIFVTWDSHRKPNKLKIGDFDTAKLTEKSGRGFTQVGTPGYIAPEVFLASGSKWHDVKADVWSFGMIIYELITLKKPYYDVNRFELSNMNEAGIRPEVPPELLSEQKNQPALKELIELYVRCTEKKPSKRPSTKSILSTLTSLQHSLN